MITIHCDNCEQPFEVDPDTAGPKVECPECGDINRVPRPAPQPASSEPREGETPADRNENLPSPSDPERELCVVRPGMFRARPMRYLVNVLLFFGGLVLAGAAWWSDAVQHWLVYPGLIAAVIALIWFGIWWLSTHFWVRLIVTNKRSVRHEGIIKRHTTEVLHDHIRSVDIRQTLMDRLLNVGDIDIDSAGQAGDRDIEISMADIPRPYEVKKLIDQYRRM